MMLTHHAASARGRRENQTKWKLFFFCTYEDSIFNNICSFESPNILLDLSFQLLSFFRFSFMYVQPTRQMMIDNLLPFLSFPFLSFPFLSFRVVSW
jgi:hypothetical protein